ncbi:MAG TPA: DoxX family protein [Anaerolineae bacterium]|jgi:uncharacterized membrane protein YphA (DoxX/SURF4 family)|nr:DoxX family protein [Anaerolineae bacterium]
MNIVLWIVQILLALVFLMAGTMKVMRPREVLAENMAWVEDFSQSQLRLIGSLEILGALALILPAVTGVLPGLAALAAVGLSLTMVGAIIVHLRRKEYPNVIMNVVLLAPVIFLAFGRIFIEPLS